MLRNMFGEKLDLQTMLYNNPGLFRYLEYTGEHRGLFIQVFAWPDGDFAALILHDDETWDVEGKSFQECYERAKAFINDRLDQATLH